MFVLMLTVQQTDQQQNTKILIIMNVIKMVKVILTSKTVSIVFSYLIR